MLALMCILIISSAAMRLDPILVGILIVGTCTGVILPDIHMKKPKKTRSKIVAWYIVQIGKQISIPVMCRTYRKLTGKIIEPGDKRLTHSIPGILIYFIILSGIIIIPAILARNNITEFLSVVFMGGIIIGLFLHLVEDLCTQKGISVFFPFNETKVHGSIHPCDIYDNRILRFHIQHGFILGIILILQVTAQSTGLLYFCGFLGICICIFSMVYQSDVRIVFPENRFSDPREVIPV